MRIALSVRHVSVNKTHVAVNDPARALRAIGRIIRITGTLGTCAADEFDGSAKLFIPHLGVRYALGQGSVRPYLQASLFKVFPFLSMSGSETDTYYNPDGSVNVDDLAVWIRDPDAVKDNRADGLADGELPRGMPDRNLTERQIDDVIAFLSTLGPAPSDALIQATEVE